MKLHHLTDWLLAPQYLLWLWDGFLLTLWLSSCTLVIATLLGFLLATARDSHLRALRWPVMIYSALFRNTPLLIQLFFWYFAVSKILPVSWMKWLNISHQAVFLGITLSWPSFEFLSGLTGLILYSAAFIAEELRAGINGVASGQKYAAHALGLTNWQSMCYVILPQALKISMPPLLGQYMNIIKNSSLTMAIGVAELSYASRQVETETLRTFQAFGVATLLYIMTIALIEAWGMWRQQRLKARGH